MTRFAIQFLGSEPFAIARDALIELVRAGWDGELALNNWNPDQVEAGDQDDKGQPLALFLDVLTNLGFV